MASVWSNTYHSKRDLYLPTPFLDQYTVKLLSHHWLPWQPAQQNVAEKKWNRNLLDFYHEDKACWEKKKSPTFLLKPVILCFNLGYWLISVLHNPNDCLPQSHHPYLQVLHMTFWEWALCSLPGLGQTLTVLQCKWTMKKTEQLQALKVLTARFFLFIQSMDSFFNTLGKGRIFETCLTAVTAFPAM